MLRYIHAFETPKFHDYLGVFYGDLPIGRIHQTRLPALLALSDLFQYRNQGLHFCDSFIHAPLKERNAQITILAEGMKQTFPSIIWRDERYGVYDPTTPSTLLFTIERGIVPLFGFPAYGTHLNLSFTHQGERYCWIAQRSATKAVEPLKLDQIVAGGLPHGLSAKENIIKEAQEEANLPYALSKHAKKIHTLHYAISEAQCCRHDSLIAFDLELSHPFTPHNQDGEVAAFYPVSHATLIALLEDPQPRFKPNSALIFIDYLLRHHALTDHPDREAIKRGISQRLIPLL